MTASDEEDELGILVRHALAIRTAASDPPTRVRVERNGAIVELEWGGATADARPAAAAAPSTPEPSPALPGLPAEIGPAPSQSKVPADATTDVHYICAATVGVFHVAAEPGAAPFVAAGDDVIAGQQVAIIEAMKLMVPVQADRAGQVVEVLLADGTAVEYGERLFVLRPAQEGS